MGWALALSAALGAGAQYWSSEKGADTAEGAANKNRQLAIENRNITLGMYEPTRALGYGAASDLATLYGWRLPEYQSLDTLTGGGVGAAPAAPSSTKINKHATVAMPVASAPGSAPAGAAPVNLYGSAMPAGNITVKGAKASKDTFGVANPWSNRDQARPGVIDPYAGTVNLGGIKNAKKEAKLEAKSQAYLRGETDKLKGKSLRRIRNTIHEIRDAGYTYDPNAVRPAPPPPPPPPQPTAGPIAGNHAMPTPGTSPDGTAGNFSRFFTSPDFQWRMDQQNRAIERSAANRGGFFSGALGAALARESGNLASQEYGNYFERLMRVLGQGGAATNQSTTSLDQTTGQIIAGNNMTAAARGNAYGQQSDAFNNLLSNLYYGYRRGA